MKLRLEDLKGKVLVLDLEYLASTYGLATLNNASVVYTTTEEFLTHLNDDEELGGEG